MIFIWTGRGFLVPLFTIGVIGLVGAVGSLGFGRDMFDLPWLTAAALVIAAAVNWWIGRRIQRRPLNTLGPGPRLRRPSRSRNSFMFVEIEYWSAVLLAGAVAILIAGA